MGLFSRTDDEKGANGQSAETDDGYHDGWWWTPDIARWDPDKEGK